MEDLVQPIVSACHDVMKRSTAMRGSDVAGDFRPTVEISSFWR
jgi:hypothetical protein